MTITRRNALRGSAALATGITLGIGTAGHAFAAESATPPETDVVVVGAGMGGLCAGLRAVENGLRCTVVEVSKWVGGGSSFSSGAIHYNNWGTTEESALEAGRGQNRNELMIQTFLKLPTLLEWLESYNLPFIRREAIEGDVPLGLMSEDDRETVGVHACVNFFNALADTFVSNGGVLLLETGAREILRDGQGTITGVRCYDTNNDIVDVHAPNVILACGGWQGDPEMRCRWLGTDANLAGVMGTPYNTGSGIKMALPLGAALQGDFSHTAGRYMPAYPAKDWMSDVESWENCGYNDEIGGKWWLWNELVTIVPGAILVNNDGQRYTDENGYHHSCHRDTCRQKHATGIQIMTQDDWETFNVELDRASFITSDEIGGGWFSADTIAELADALNASNVSSYAVNKAALIATVDAYNEAVAQETIGDLSVPHSGVAHAFENGPFYAVPIRSAIFEVYGGLAVDLNSQVVDSLQKPIKGLYATAPCAGGFCQEFYGGSIASAGITGMAAADAIGAIR